MSANFLALYLAAMREVCKMVVILDVLWFGMLNWGGAGMDIPEEFVGRLGVEVSAGCVVAVVA